MVRIIALATPLILGAGSVFAGDIQPAEIEPQPQVQMRTGGMGYGKYVAMGIGAVALGGIIYAIAHDSGHDNDNDRGSTTGTTGTTSTTGTN